jgi:uncharacterized protein YraI
MAGKIRLRLWFGALLCGFSAAATAQNAITAEPADLYAGPDDNYPVVAELDSNTPIQVFGCLDDWSWCDVGVGDSRGWLYSPDIVYRYEGGYVPLYSYAPSLGIAVVPFSMDLYWDRHYHDRPWYSRRDEWEHRGFEHRRPPGPPPSAGPPPRSEIREGPREAARPDERRLRLGSAEPPRPDADRRNMERRDFAPNATHPEPPPPEARPAPRPEPRPEPRPMPRPEQHAPPPAPPPHEERAHGAVNAGPPPAREERPRPPEPPRPERDERPH